MGVRKHPGGGGETYGAPVGREIAGKTNNDRLMIIGNNMIRIYIVEGKKDQLERQKKSWKRFCVSRFQASQWGARGRRIVPLTLLVVLIQVKYESC